MNETKVRKKLGLLKQKILTSTHITHNNQQYLVGDLNREQQQLENELRQNLKQFKNSMEMAKDKYEKQLEEYQNYIDEDIVHQRSVNLNTLKGYLNQEKASLKKLLEDEEKSSQKDDDRLHRLVKKRNLEMLLRQVRRKKLETEIKHLEQSFISNKVILYELPEQKMTQKEEEMLNQKISMLLDQVKRLCQLQQNCKTQNSQDISKLQDTLKKQTLRLQNVQNFIGKENEEVKKFEKWVQSFDSIEIPFYLKSNHESMSYHQIDRQIDPQNIQEIKRLWNSSEGIICSMSVTNEEIGGDLKTIKQQLKRLQSQL